MEAILYRKATRRQLLFAGAAALVLDRKVLAQETRPPRILRLVGPWEITGLDPAVSGYLFTRMQVTETLIDADDQGRLLPGMASRWWTSTDRLSWRFSLRAGARFHDGTPVTPVQVAWVLQRAQRRPGILAMAPVSAIFADGNDIVIRLMSPFSALPALLAHSSTQILAAASFSASGDVTAVIGSGPYRITAIAPPQMFRVALFGGWKGPRPVVTEATFLSVARVETRALMAESGQADITYELDPASIRRLGKNPQIAIQAVTVPRTVILKINAGHRFLNDRQVRQAVSLALDRAGIARALLRDPEMAATQLFPPALPAWHLPSLPPLRHDPAEARRLLTRSGWQTAADRMLVRNGERFQLTLRTFPDRPELLLFATAIQEQLRQVGIALKVVIGNSSDIPAGHRDGTLELALAARNFALIPDPIGTVFQDYGRQDKRRGGDWGAMNWASDELDRAIDELLHAPESGRNAPLRAKVARILHAELPVIPVTWYRQTAAIGPRVAGVTIDPLERSYRLTNIRWANPLPKSVGAI